jgi:hypothetical protein
MLEKRKRLLFSIIIGVTLPWLITLIFILSLGSLTNIVQAVDGNPLSIYTMIVFYSFNLTWEIPILGNGFWLCFVSWAIAGLFIGLITRDLKQSIVAATSALLINFILYLVLVFNVYIPTELIDPLVNSALYSSFTVLTPFRLLAHLAIHSFLLPILFFFTLSGGFLRDRLSVKVIDHDISDKIS